MTSEFTSPALLGQVERVGIFESYIRKQRSRDKKSHNLPTSFMTSFPLKVEMTETTRFFRHFSQFLLRFIFNLRLGLHLSPYFCFIASVKPSSFFKMKCQDQSSFEDGIASIRDMSACCCSLLKDAQAEIKRTCSSVNSITVALGPVKNCARVILKEAQMRSIDARFG